VLDEFDGRTRWIDALGIIPSRCIERVDKVDGDKALFHGCHDWHSSVHGHWALFRMGLAGSGRHRDEVARAGRRLTEEGVSAVISDLERDPGFEMPYGRAWLLKLVVEYERWAQKNGATPSRNWRQLGDCAAGSLVDHYLGECSEQDPDILSNQHGNDSFAVVQLFDYLRHRGDRRLGVVQGYIAEHFVDRNLCFDPELDSDPDAFLSPFWSWVYLLARTQPDETLRRLVNVDRIGEGRLRPMARQEITGRRVHHLGMNWSRAWAIKALARRVLSWKSRRWPAERLVESYHAHIESGLRAHEDFTREHPDVDQWEAYYAYYHWVPQFGIYAITD
jgi:hypothetical protein